MSNRRCGHGHLVRLQHVGGLAETRDPDEPHGRVVVSSEAGHAALGAEPFNLGRLRDAALSGATWGVTWVLAFINPG